MKPYLLSIGAGLLAGVFYSLLNVRSPAPPPIALLGLLGILLGEQALPAARHLFAGRDVAHSPRAERKVPVPPVSSTSNANPVDKDRA